MAHITIHEVPAKETLYKTAWSPLFGVCVAIESAWTDSNGDWIFQCSSNYDGRVKLNNILFRKHELTDYCL